MPAGVPELRLESRLLLKSLERDVADSNLLSRVDRRKISNGAEPSLIQALHLVATDVGNQAEMIVLVPPRRTPALVLAKAAMRHRVWITRHTLADSRHESGSNRSVIGIEVPVPQALMLVRTEDDHHLAGLHTLDAGDLLGVKAQLQHEVRLRPARQLRVPGLVAPRAELGRLLDAHEEIADAVPITVNEDALIDDRSPFTHRGAGSLGVLEPVPVTSGAFDADDVAALAAEARQPCALVLGTLLGEQIGMLVTRRARRARLTLEFESNQVLALEKVIEVARGKQNPLTDSLHGNRLVAREAPHRSQRKCL